MYTGEVLFTGNSNNDMLRVFQNYLGKMTKKMVNMTSASKKHFNKEGEYLWHTADKTTRRIVTKVMSDFPTLRLEDLILNHTKPDVSQQHKRKARQLGDFLVKCLIYDPQKRYTPDQALEHAFITEKWVEEKEKEPEKEKEKDEKANHCFKI
jgi:serine/threonine-protein kinase PRP4